jgi:hypothetical protein
MCPACLAALAIIVAGATSTGGLAAVVVSKIRSDTSAKSSVASSKEKPNQTKESGHEQEHD